MTSARTHMCAIRAVICSPASSDVITNMPNCDAAFDVPLYAAAAALTPCSRPTLSTKHDFARCTSSNEIRLETHFAIFAVSLDACFCTYMQLCVRAPLARLVFNWISSLPSRSLPKLTTHAPDEVLACYIPSERDIYSAVLPANRDLRRQVKKPSYL